MYYSQEKCPDTLTQPKSNILLLSINNFTVIYQLRFSYCSTYNISTKSPSWSVLANADVSVGFYPTLIKMMWFILKLWVSIVESNWPQRSLMSLLRGDADLKSTGSPPEIGHSWYHHISFKVIISKMWPWLPQTPPQASICWLLPASDHTHSPWDPAKQRLNEWVTKQAALRLWPDSQSQQEDHHSPHTHTPPFSPSLVESRGHSEGSKWKQLELGSVWLLFFHLSHSMNRSRGAELGLSVSILPFAAVNHTVVCTHAPKHTHIVYRH